MKSITSILGIILIIFGIITFAYQNISYTQREKIMQIGDVQVTADTQKTVYFPPMLSGLSLITGIVLIIISRK